jgi:hypothetical protein
MMVVGRAFGASLGGVSPAGYLNYIIVLARDESILAIL